MNTLILLINSSQNIMLFKQFLTIFGLLQAAKWQLYRNCKMYENNWDGMLLQIETSGKNLHGVIIQ